MHLDMRVGTHDLADMGLHRRPISGQVFEDREL